jgi:hypothetical protein
MSDQKRKEALIQFVILCLGRGKDGAEVRQSGRFSDYQIGDIITSGNDKGGRSIVSNFKKAKKKTAGGVVDLLARLRRGFKNRYTSGEDSSPSSLITSEHIYIALQKLISLTPEEKQDLNILSDDSEILLQQSLLNIYVYQKPWNYDSILDIYRRSIALELTVKNHRTTPGSQPQIDDWIEDFARIHQETYLGWSKDDGGNSPKNKMKIPEKVRRELDRILLNAGTNEITLKRDDGIKEFQSDYLSYGFIKRLTQSVFENELLTEQLPIFLQDIAIESCGPFPLKVAQRFEDVSGVLAEPLLNIDRDYQIKESQIASHSVNRVTLKLYMRISDTSKRYIKSRLEHQIQTGNNGFTVVFESSSKGIGGTLSHITKSLNNVLLYDIDCLKEYFPIARDIFLEHNLTCNNAPSPVVAHSLVSLCNIDVLSYAMAKSANINKLSTYSQFSFNDPLGRGDYCGFDILSSMAQAALQARLRAIKRTTKAPVQYINDLYGAINYSAILKQSELYVKGYPFSSLAQESFLIDMLENTPLKDLKLGDSPYALFEACLCLAETFLEEGAHVKAKEYLDVVKAVLEGFSEIGIRWHNIFENQSHYETDFKYFPGTLIVRYELCQATYSYLKSEILSAWERLNKAEKHLSIRLFRYRLINEISQSTFDPHYELKARIYFLRARLVIFFPRQRPDTIPSINIRNSTIESDVHAGRLFYMEKARFYAACNGDSELYASLTAYQAICYLFASFYDKPNIVSSSNNEFSLTTMLAKGWARRLRDEALIAYTEVGRRYYFEIKEKSGVSNELSNIFGRCKVSPIPVIREIFQEDSPGLENLKPLDESNVVTENTNSVLRLDMSILTIYENSIKKGGKDYGSPIYLLGSSACYLFLIRGFYYLLSDYIDEFDESKSVKELEDWDRKLKHAHRLFNYAWAIAADGGQVSLSKENSEDTFTIHRKFSVSADIKFEQDVASVRDLYPHRVTDIAALGALFSAACAVLRLYTASNDEHDQCLKIIDFLLTDSYKIENFQNEGVQESYCGQVDFDAHLKDFLEAGKEILEKEKERVSKNITATELKNRRDYLIRSLVASPFVEEVLKPTSRR